MLHKQINKSDIVNYETRIKSAVSLTSESLDSVQFISGSTNSGYWNLFKHNYYDNTVSWLVMPLKMIVSVDMLLNFIDHIVAIMLIFHS